MARYSKEFKEKIVQKMMPPNAQSVAQIHRDTGVSEPTLYNWRNQYKNEGRAVPADPSNPENWSAQDKLAVVIETASLNEQALSEYCRKKGLYVEQFIRWKELALELQIRSLVEVDKGIDTTCMEMTLLENLKRIHTCLKWIVPEVLLVDVRV